ncbi:hypothetical protein G9A89_017962 [Geosiphon pyriformis]|nr:hypothetical protein G9A89_017962 [Geosiphon pyriformis]
MEILSKILLGTTKGFGATIVETSNCSHFSELLVFLTIFFEEEMPVASDVKTIEGNTSLLTGLLLNTFGLLVGVEATLGLIQVCFFKGILTSEKPAKDKKIASVTTKDSFSQLLGKEKTSKTFCLVASTTERAPLIEILLDILGKISGTAYLFFALVVNWADQMETESSPPLVSGTTSGGAWETITSHQRFTGWVASTLVPGATFKIKLAYIKTVFQSVHGFLGAKSVSKDNIKLFCMKFASQQFLEAAFLVELTSSVHLTTLKIAKSLVVSESGSSPAAVALRNVPLGVSTADVKLALNVFGSVTGVVLKPAGIWQYVVVYFEKLDSAVSVLKHWSVLVCKNSIRILSLVNQNETILSYNKFKAKLINLLPGCTTFEISNMISQIGGQTCFISYSPNSGCCFQFALVIFDFQNNLDSVIVKTETPGCQRCFRCQEMGHLAADCKIFSPSTSKIFKVFKSYFVGSASYTKTAALSDLFEFPLLVASLAASAANPAVSSKLDSLEKQISDLAALIKSIVEPVGSLVVLVSRLLNDNAAKAVQVKKDIISMKSAANNFSNLMVGVSKNIACLRSEVDFGNMDYDGMLAAKPSFLSEDTIEHVIALSNIESTRLFFSEFIFDSRNLNDIIERIHGLELFSPTFDSA